MTNMFKHPAGKTGSFRWSAWLAISLCAVALLVVAALYIPAVRDFFGSGVTAAWVQAVGSIGAILASAALVMWKHKLDLEKEQASKAEDLRVMLESIKIEIEAIWDDLDALIADVIEASAALPQDWEFVYSEQAFPVYRTLAPRIAIISNARLRLQIVQTYSKANSWFLRMSLHNQLKRRADDLRLQLSVAGTKSDASFTELGDVLESPDILGVGISEYDALARELKRTNEKLSAGAKQIIKGVQAMREDVLKLKEYADEELQRLPVPVHPS